jgi:hypothetical protein
VDVGAFETTLFHHAVHAGPPRFVSAAPILLHEENNGFAQVKFPLVLD